MMGVQTRGTGAEQPFKVEDVAACPALLGLQRYL